MKNYQSSPLTSSISGIQCLLKRTVISKWVFLILFAVTIQVQNAKATAVSGAQITYEHVDSQKYDIYLTIYRDCRGVGLSNPSNQSRLYCPGSGKTASLSYKLYSITDITPVCASATKPCTPANTYGTGKGIEKHVYVARVNFADSGYRKIYNCGEVLIEYGICCRNGSITTGASNQNAYYYTMVDFSKVDSNNSPVLLNEPIFFLSCNSPYYEYFGGYDKDGDSLSYHGTLPLKGYNSTIAYSGNFSASKPFTVYDPTGSGKVFPYITPPVGYFFDSKNGGIILTPTNCTEATVLAFEVREWRKDSTGKYQHIGTVEKDIMCWVEQQAQNNPPLLDGPFDFTVCENDSVHFKITVSDQVVVPPPPLPTPLPDTVSISWGTLFSDASVKLLPTSTTMDTAMFTWRAKYDSGKTNTQSFIVKAKDSHCGRYRSTSRVFTINVLPEPKADMVVTQGQCGKFAVDAQNLKNVNSIQWALYDSKGGLVSDLNKIKFQSTGKFASTALKDSFQLNDNGTYFLRLRLIVVQGCERILWDTISRTEKHYQLFSWSDSLLCDDWNKTLQPDVDTSEFAHFSWNNSALDTFGSLRITQVNGLKTYKLDAVSNEGCRFEDSVTVRTRNKPVISMVNDSTFCPPVELELDAEKIVSDGGLTTQILWDNGNTTALRSFDKPGTYGLSATNVCGADSITFRFSEGLDPARAPYIRPLDDDTICNPVKLDVNGRALTTENNLLTFYRWENGDTTALRRISRKGTFQLTATNRCGADTMEFSIFEDFHPWLENIQDQILCLPGTITLTAKDLQDPGTTPREYTWSNGTSGDKATFDRKGRYHVIADAMCGSDTTDFYIETFTAPNVKLGNDIFIKKPFSIELVADTVKGEYYWNTGDTTRSITVTEWGKYLVTVTNPCGTSQDFITIDDLVSVPEVNKQSIEIIPNPNNGQFTLRSGGLDLHINKITDITGKEIEFESSLVEEGQVVKLYEPVAGIYFMETALNGSILVVKVTITQTR